MKTTPVCSIFLSLIACNSLAWAQGPDAGRGEQKPAAARELWQKVDENKDGSISRAEFASMPRLNKLPEDKRQALFDRLDKNGDGAITPAELRLANADSQNPRPGPPRLGELDKNSDGAVSFEEFQEGRLFQRLDPQRQRRIFNRLDSNGDGKITPQDKPPHRPQPNEGDRPRPGDGVEGGPDKPRKPRVPGLIGQLDKDGDGAVSFEELKASPRMSHMDEETLRRRYRMLDRNRDGVVDINDMPRRENPRPGPPPEPEELPESEADIE